MLPFVRPPIGKNRGRFHSCWIARTGPDGAIARRDLPRIKGGATKPGGPGATPCEAALTHGLSDYVWLSLTAALVMLMQAGFCLLETGLVRAKNSIHVAVKNVVDFLIATALFWLVGFGLMFGTDWCGLVGTSQFAPGPEVGSWAILFLFFQMMFCGTSTTILSGALAERIRFRAYVAICVLVSGLFYPLFGHWAWGGNWQASSAGWLGKLGFIDFAGSTCVHSLGGWIALAAVLVVGPRSGRFTPGNPPIVGHNVPMAAVGVLLLWFSWYGFNGGSTFGLDHRVPIILLNTTLAASMGGATALAIASLHRGLPDVPRTLNGILAGLVSVTAGCAVVSPIGAALLGIGAGAICYVGSEWLDRLEIDDAIHAIPVHAFAGVWGTIGLAVIADPALFPQGHGIGRQLAVQTIGAIACFAWAFGGGFLALWLLNRFLPLRVSLEAEKVGLNVAEHGARNDLVQLLAEMSDQRQGDRARPLTVEPHTEVGEIAAVYNHVMTRVELEIAAREEVVAALRAAEEKYRGIFENAVEGIFQTSPDGRYVSANPALARIYGYPSPDELMASVGDIREQLYVDGARRDEFIRRVRAEGMVSGFVSEVYRKDGARIWISESARAVLDGAGNVRFYEGTVEDVTERIRAEELARQSDAAVAASNAKSLFLANLSHEIRTPLNGVIGMIELLGRTELSAQQRRYARIAKSSADALLGLINHILDFSKIEANKLELERIEFDPRGLLEDTTEMFTFRAEEKGLELACHLGVELPDLLIGDPERLRQIAINLLNNAIKFTEKGEVVLRATVQAETETSLEIKVEVTDTGIGIPEERMDRLFQAFSQVDESTTRKHGGTGLGLVISKQLAERMHGQMGVTSRVGEGSTFWWTARLEKTPNSRRAEKSLPRQLAHARVLAVDDNATVLSILRDYLAEWDMELVAAPHGRAALECLHDAAARGEGFSLALIDGQMPGMNGLQLARVIQQSPELKHTQLILLTSLNDTSEADQYQSLGIAGCLSKPVRKSRLLEILSRVRCQRAPRGQSRPIPEEAKPALELRKGPRILLAEDNPVNQLVATEILVAAGYQVDVAGTGTAAIRAAIEKPYDLVLMDCQMPEMDGFAATLALRDHERKGTLAGSDGVHLPILALTASGGGDDREQCTSVGMDGYIPKPIEPRVLLHRVAAALTKVGKAAPPPGKIINGAAKPRTAAADAAPAPVEAPGELANPVESPPTPNGSTQAPVENSDGAARRAESEDDPIDVPDLLHRCVGDVDFLEGIVREFAKRLLEDVARLQDATDGQDWRKMTREAHSLKGSAGNLSAGPLRRLAVELEIAAKRQDLAAGCFLMDRVRKETKRFIAYADTACKTARSLIETKIADSVALDGDFIERYEENPVFR